MHSMGSRWLWRSGLVVFVIVLATIVARVGERLFDPPQARGDAEAELGHPLLSYEIWDGTPYTVFELDGRIHFDRLFADPTSIDWPPRPQWQWCGQWSYLPVTGNPASVAVSDVPIPNVLFGQVNDPGIVALAVDLDGVTHTWSVSGPAFAVQLPEETSARATVDFLNADGQVVWTAEVQDG